MTARVMIQLKQREVIRVWTIELCGRCKAVARCRGQGDWGSGRAGPGDIHLLVLRSCAHWGHGNCPDYVAVSRHHLRDCTIIRYVSDAARSSW